MQCYCGSENVWAQIIIVPVSNYFARGSCVTYKTMRGKLKMELRLWLNKYNLSTLSVKVHKTSYL